MKTLFVVMVMMSTSAMADTWINRTTLGSGTPGEQGVEVGHVMPDKVYFTPQYMPGYPTAATIWPRVVEVNCEGKDQSLVCEGYHWTPKMGRGEYLFYVPKNTPTPNVNVSVTVQGGNERVIERVIQVPVLVEVDRKKKSE